MKGYYCTVCKRSFGRGGAFNSHKTGHFGKPIYREKKLRTGAITKIFIGYSAPTRRCLTDEEMIAKGLRETDDGLWIVAVHNEDNRWDRKMVEEEQEIEEEEALERAA